jgi:GH18 family chitinase
MKKILLPLLLIFLIISKGFTQNASAGKSTFCEKKMVGYVTNWSVNTTIDYSGMTHAFFAFLKPSLDGSYIEYTSEQEMALFDYLKKTKKFGCKRFISLGGGGDEVFPIVAADPVLRQKFINSVIEFCQEKKFDGIDMDWEAMDDEAKKKNYTLIMIEFRQACKIAGLQLTATILV